MFNDINLSIDNNEVNYQYVISKNKIIIKTNELPIGSCLKIFYDENIYEIKLDENIKINHETEDTITILLNSNELWMEVILKKNFIVKSIYKYINKFSNKDTLIEEIKLFLKMPVSKKYHKDLTNLLANIENQNIDIDTLILNNTPEFERIVNILLNNQTFEQLINNMSDLELMLLITSYIYAPLAPQINQDVFNNLVNVAKNYANNLESIWRLGMNYDNKGYNYDLLDDFFVNSKNVYYLGEYISGIEQINPEKIINAIVNTKDKKFIKEVYEDELITESIDKKYLSILKSFI